MKKTWSKYGEEKLFKSKFGNSDGQTYFRMYTIRIYNSMSQNFKSLNSVAVLKNEIVCAIPPQNFDAKFCFNKKVDTRIFDASLRNSDYSDMQFSLKRHRPERHGIKDATIG